MGRRHLRDDRGAILVIGAVMLTALVVTTAIVADLGLVRHARRSSQSVADLSALAAGEALAADTGPDGRTACQDAVTYLEANEPALDNGLTVPCSSLPASCDFTTAPTTVSDAGTAGSGWAVEITYPVANSEIFDTDIAAADQLRLDDGIPCERLEVRVRRTFDSIFAGVLGRDRFSIDAAAIVRVVQASDRTVPALWLLDPYGCPALDVQGSSSVTVGTSTRAGIITIDSDASSCGGNSFTIDVGGSGSSIRAIPDSTTPPGQISLVAMERTQTSCSTGNPNACDPADVAALTLDPQPVRRANRATRAPVDHRYNCKSSYPQFYGLTIDPCTSGEPDHVDDLRSAVGASGTPSGFQLWSDFYGCNGPAVPPTGLDGNWHVDCRTLRIGNGDNVVFNGGNVILDGDVDMTGGTMQFNAANPVATLPVACTTTVVGCIADSAATAAWVFMRDGDLRLTGGALVANRSTIFQESGYFSIAGGSPPVWRSPTEGPFSGLSVWSEEASNRFQINGGASMELEGTFFTPNANTLSISGGAPVIPQQAQFVSFRLAVSGGAALTLTPNQTTGVVLPAEPPLLIR